MFIQGCQWVEIEENCERFTASTKRKFLSFVWLVGFRLYGTKSPFYTQEWKPDDIVLMG
jgi:hypothetical protein